MNKLAFWLALAAGPTLSACSTILNNLPGVYSLDIEQGNKIDQSMVDQLRPNMTKRQVVYIMGSPMLTDSFHDKRWDYIYSSQPGGGDRIQKRVTLFFNGDNLVGVQGDLRPSSMPVALDKAKVESSLDLPKRDLEKSMWDKVTGIFGDDSDSAPHDNTNTASNQRSGSKRR